MKILTTGLLIAICPLIILRVICVLPILACKMRTHFILVHQISSIRNALLLFLFFVGKDIISPSIISSLQPFMPVSL